MSYSPSRPVPKSPAYHEFLDARQRAMELTDRYRRAVELDDRERAALWDAVRRQTESGCRILETWLRSDEAAQSASIVEQVAFDSGWVAFGSNPGANTSWQS
jgi:hypothetical protein